MYSWPSTSQKNEVEFLRPLSYEPKWKAVQMSQLSEVPHPSEDWPPRTNLNRTLDLMPVQGCRWLQFRWTLGNSGFSQTGSNLRSHATESLLLYSKLKMVCWEQRALQRATTSQQGWGTEKSRNTECNMPRVSSANRLTKHSLHVSSLSLPSRTQTPVNWNFICSIPPLYPWGWVVCPVYSMLLINTCWMSEMGIDEVGTKCFHSVTFNSLTTSINGY